MAAGARRREVRILVTAAHANATRATDESMIGESILNPKLVAFRFNEAINKRDRSSLAAMLTDDHQFIDSAGHVTAGREATTRAWSKFFQAFPDYRNAFEAVENRESLVLIRGRSTCEHPDLDGPAIWTARIEDDKVAEWRVYEDDAETRESLRLG